MKNKYELQYVIDSLLIEKLAKISYGIDPFVKEASFIDTVENYIKSWAKDTFDTSSTGAFAESLVKMIEPGILGNIHPILGILDRVLQDLTGISITSIVVGIIKSVVGDIKNGKDISHDVINNLASSAVGGIEQFASLDLLRDLEKQGKLVLFIKIAKRGSIPGISQLSDLISNLSKTGPIGKQRGKGLVGGFAAWIVKAMLKGAGLSLLTHSVEKAVNVNSKTTSNPDVKMPEILHKDSIPYLPKAIPNNFKSSGIGEETHSNDETHVWNLPIQGSIENSLVNWAQQIYPELKGYEKEIKSSQAFNRLVNILRNFVDAGYLRVPTGFETRRQIVDTFAGDIKLKG